MGNYAKAADDFRKVLQLKPNDADAESRLNTTGMRSKSSAAAPDAHTAKVRRKRGQKREHKNPYHPLHRQPGEASFGKSS